MAGVLAGMLLLDLHKVSIAIPALERSLHPGPTGIQLVHSSYVLAFALTLLPAGRLGDRGGRSRLIGIGLALYLAASALCTFAPGIELVIAGRAALGVAAGILMPQAMGLVQSLFSGEERGRAFGVYGVCVSLATALGPSVGGLLVWLGGDVHGWRGVFALNLPVGVALAVSAAILLPRLRDELAPSPSAVPHKGGDAVGLAVFGAAIVLVLAPFILTTGRPGDPVWRWLLVLPAAALAVVFVARSRERGRAGRGTVIDVTLLQLPSLRNGVLISLTWFATGPAFVLGLTVYLQTAVGLNALAAGMLQLPSAAASALGAALGGRHVARQGRRLTIIGMLLSAGGMLASTACLGLPLVGIFVAIPLLQLVIGFGGGLVVSPNHAQTLADVPRDRGGAAGSLGQLAQRVSNSVGVSLAAVAFFTPIYGSGATLDSAAPAVTLAAAHAATAVSLCFLALALTVALVDRHRQRSVAALAVAA